MIFGTLLTTKSIQELVPKIEYIHTKDYIQIDNNTVDDTINIKNYLKRCFSNVYAYIDNNDTTLLSNKKTRLKNVNGIVANTDVTSTDNDIPFCASMENSDLYNNKLLHDDSNNITESHDIMKEYIDNLENYIEESNYIGKKTFSLRDISIDEKVSTYLENEKNLQTIKVLYKYIQETMKSFIDIDDIELFENTILFAYNELPIDKTTLNIIIKEYMMKKNQYMLKKHSELLSTTNSTAEKELEYKDKKPIAITPEQISILLEAVIDDDFNKFEKNLNILPLEYKYDVKFHTLLFDKLGTLSPDINSPNKRFHIKRPNFKKYNNNFYENTRRSNIFEFLFERSRQRCLLNDPNWCKRYHLLRKKYTSIPDDKVDLNHIDLYKVYTTSSIDAVDYIDDVDPLESFLYRDIIRNDTAFFDNESTDATATTTDTVANDENDINITEPQQAPLIYNTLREISKGLEGANYDEYILQLNKLTKINTLNNNKIKAVDTTSSLSTTHITNTLNKNDEFMDIHSSDVNPTYTRWENCYEGQNITRSLDVYFVMTYGAISIITNNFTYVRIYFFFFCFKYI